MPNSSASLSFCPTTPSNEATVGKRKRAPGDKEEPNKKARVSQDRTHNRFLDKYWDLETHLSSEPVVFEDLSPFWQVSYKRKRSEADEPPSKRVKLAENPVRERGHTDPRIRAQRPGASKPQPAYNRQASSQAQSKPRLESQNYVATRQSEARGHIEEYPRRQLHKQQASSHSTRKVQFEQDARQLARGSKRMPSHRERVPGEQRLSERSLDGRVHGGRVADGRASGRQVVRERVPRQEVPLQRRPEENFRRPEPPLRGVLHQQNDLQATLLAQPLDPSSLRPHPAYATPRTGHSVQQGRSENGNRGATGCQGKGYRLHGVELLNSNSPTNIGTRGSQDNRHRTKSSNPRDFDAPSRQGMRAQDQRHPAQSQVHIPQNRGHPSQIRRHPVQGSGHTTNFPTLNSQGTRAQDRGHQAHDAQAHSTSNAPMRESHRSDLRSAPVGKKVENVALEDDLSRDETSRGLRVPTTAKGTSNRDRALRQMTAPITEQPLDVNAWNKEQPGGHVPRTEFQPQSQLAMGFRGNSADADASLAKEVGNMVRSSESYKLDLPALGSYDLSDLDAWIAENPGNIIPNAKSQEPEESASDTRQLLSDLDAFLARELGNDFQGSAAQEPDHLAPDLRKPFPDSNSWTANQTGSADQPTEQEDEREGLAINSQESHFDFDAWVLKELGHESTSSIYSGEF